VDESSAPRLEEERRRLWDRRAPDPRRGTSDRRTRDRRRTVGDPAEERRSGSDRRKGGRRRAIERRSLTDRRRGLRWRETPTPFTPDQIAELKRRFTSPGPVRCPACGSRVALGWARHTATEKARRVMCLGCGRGAIVPDAGAARILVVSGNEALRDILQTALLAAGHDVVEAAGGGVGLAAYEAGPADVVLLDVQAPGTMDPEEFLRRLRGASPGACVIALVPRASQPRAGAGAGPGELAALPTIALPISRDELLRTVYETCGGPSTTRTDP
jgi:CheY-like chemotaxis protein